MNIKIVDIPDTKINTSLNPLPREEANAELEKDEIVLNPDLTLYKVRGKSHAQGGTPLNLDQGAFIFSKTPSLSFNKEDHKEMRFSEPDSYSSKNTTPAKVLSREIKGGLKHHNNMVNIINNPNNHDNITLNTANLMLQKNLEKLGQIAFKQEEKKRFEQGIPPVAINTAPVIDPNLDEAMIKNRQYTPTANKNNSLPFFREGGPTSRKSIGYRIPDGMNLNPTSIVVPGSESNMTKEEAFMDFLKKSGMSLGEINYILENNNMPSIASKDTPTSAKVSSTPIDYDKWFKDHQEFIMGFDPKFFDGVNLMKPAPKGVTLGEEVPGLFKRAINSANFAGGKLNSELNRKNVGAYQQFVNGIAPEAINTFYKGPNPSMLYNNKSSTIPSETFVDYNAWHDFPELSKIRGKSPDDIANKAKRAGLIPSGKNFIFKDGNRPTIFIPEIVNESTQTGNPSITLNTVNPEALKKITPNYRIAPPAKDQSNFTPKDYTSPLTQTGGGKKEKEKEGFTPTISTRYKIGLTPWQKLNLIKTGAEAIGVKTYYPMRQHQESILTTPELMSENPLLANINQAAHTATLLNRLHTMPQMSIAANEQIGANRIDQGNNAIGQVQVQNLGTINQSKAQNAATLNQDAAANRASDKLFFDQTTTALQNRDEEKEIRRNAYINELNQYMAENQELENVINSQQQYKTNVPIKNRKGQIIGYKSALPYEPTTGFFGRGFRYNPNINAEALLNSQIDIGTQNDAYLTALQDFVLKNLNSTDPSIEKKLDWAGRTIALNKYRNNKN